MNVLPTKKKWKLFVLGNLAKQIAFLVSLVLLIIFAVNCIFRLNLFLKWLKNTEHPESYATKGLVSFK